MKFIQALDDYYGKPGYKLTYVNPNQIIEVEEIIENKEENIPAHFIIRVNYGKEIKKYHITKDEARKFL